jgi:hypothetical protein
MKKAINQHLTLKIRNLQNNLNQNKSLRKPIRAYKNKSKMNLKENKRKKEEKRSKNNKNHRNRRNKLPLKENQNQKNKEEVRIHKRIR